MGAIGRAGAAAILLVLLLASCGGSGSGSGGGTTAPTTGAAEADEPTPGPDEPPLRPITGRGESNLPVTVTGADGVEVTITDTSRIVPLWGNIAETVFTLGFGDRVVGKDISATFPEADHLPLVTRAHDVSAEAVLSLDPTLVLAQTDTGPPEAIQHLRDAGVPVLVLAAPTDVDEVGERIAAVAEALGAPELGDALAQRTDAEISAAQAAIPQGAPAPKVAFLYMRGPAGVYLMAGPGSGADSMIAAAGGSDAGTAMGLDRPFTPLTSEALVGAAPDVILMTTTGLESVGGLDGLLEIPGIAQTTAARDRRVVTIEDGLLYSFGARTPEALATLVAALHGSTPAG